MRVCDLYVINVNETSVTVEADGNFGSSQMVIPMTSDDFMASVKKWDEGALVQVAFPNLNAVQREFLMTGMYEKQQKEMFGSDEDPENN